jgi:hypothetical protein
MPLPPNTRIPFLTFAILRCKMFHFNLSNSNSILHRFVLICGCVIAIGMAIAVTPRSISF